MEKSPPPTTKANKVKLVRPTQKTEGKKPKQPTESNLSGEPTDPNPSGGRTDPNPSGTPTDPNLSGGPTKTKRSGPTKVNPSGGPTEKSADEKWKVKKTKGKATPDGRMDDQSIRPAPIAPQGASQPQRRVEEEDTEAGKDIPSRPIP